MHQLSKLTQHRELVHGISSVSDGNMSFLWGEEKETLYNRINFLKKLNIDSKRCVFMSVLDSDKISIMDENIPLGIEKNLRISADALVTAEKNTFLVLLTGDCLPVIFFDPTHHVLALAHLSWKSTGVNLSKKVVSFLKEKYNTKLSDLIVGIGPGVRKESYIMDKISPEQEKSSDWKNFINKTSNGWVSIDLVGYNISQLVGAGVRNENIEISPVDTAKDINFFSHYRSKRTGEKEGRFVTVVGVV